MVTENSVLPITLAEPASRGDFLAYPSRLRPRWILPTEKCLRRSSLQLYVPQRLGGHFRKQLLARGILQGEPVAVPEAGRLAELFAGALGCNVCLAFLVGTPGAYQKVTARVMNPRGEVLAYAKLASHPLAVSALDNEQRTLERLATVPTLRLQVPQVLMWQRQNGAAALLLTAGPDKPGSQRLTAAHQDFLRSLNEAFQEQRPFSTSGIWRSMNRLYTELGPSLSRQWCDRYERALALLERDLGETTVSLTLAHRDFTPWNTRLASDGTLFVFDWEFAEMGYPSTYDSLHYMNIGRAISHRQARAANGRSRWFGRPSPLHLHYLAYLMDVSLFYQSARRSVPQKGNDKVSDWCGYRIHELTENLS